MRSWSRSTDRRTCTTRSGGCRAAFDRIAQGPAQSIGGCTSARRGSIVRSVVQRLNHACLSETTRAVHGLGVDRLSFLAADVSSMAFNRPEPWDAARRSEVALSDDELLALERSIRAVEASCRDLIASGFIAGGVPSLWRILEYFRALLGHGAFPDVRCNAPWTSAVLEPDNRVRPCFFHPFYPSSANSSLDVVLNSTEAIAFRRDAGRSDECHVPALRLLAVIAGVGKRVKVRGQALSSGDSPCYGRVKPIAAVGATCTTRAFAAPSSWRHGIPQTASHVRKSSCAQGHRGVFGRWRRQARARCQAARRRQRAARNRSRAPRVSRRSEGGRPPPRAPRCRHPHDATTGHTCAADR